MIIQNGWYSVDFDQNVLHIISEHKKYKLHGPMIEKYFFPIWKKIVYGADKHVLIKELIHKNKDKNLDYSAIEFENLIKDLINHGVIIELDCKDISKNENYSFNITILNCTRTNISDLLLKIIKDHYKFIRCDNLDLKVDLHEVVTEFLRIERNDDLKIIFMDRYIYTEVMKYLKNTLNSNMVILPVMIDSGNIIAGPSIIDFSKVDKYIIDLTDLYQFYINRSRPILNMYNSSYLYIAISLIIDEILGFYNRKYSVTNYQLKLVDNVSVYVQDAMMLNNFKI